MIAIDQHIVNVNTENEEFFKSGDSSSFEYDLNFLQTEKYQYVSVIQAEIPKSFYNIDDPFNFFYLNEGTGDIKIILTEGNYDRFTFITEVKDKLNTLGTRTYEMELIEPLNKWKITVSPYTDGVDTIQIKSDYYLFRQLGFLKNTTNTFDSNGELISTRVVELSSNPNIFLRTDMPLLNINDNELLQVIPTTQILPFSYITFQQNDLIDTARRVDIKKGSRNVYRFFFTTGQRTQTNDEQVGQFRPIDFNGVGLSFTLLFFNKVNIGKILKDTNKILLTK